MEPKILPLLSVVILLVFPLLECVTEAMPLGGIIGNSNVGLGFYGGFKAANLNRKINLESSEEYLDTDSLNRQINNIQEFNADAPPEILDSSDENDILQNSNEKEAAKISEEIPEGSDNDSESDNGDVSDNSDENKFIGFLASNSDTDDSTSSDVLETLEETSTKQDIREDDNGIEDAEPDSGLVYIFDKDNGLGEGVSLNFGNDNYYIENEDDSIMSFPVQRGKYPYLDYGYYNFDSNNYVRNLI